MSGPSRRIDFLLSSVTGSKAISVQLSRIAALQQGLTRALPANLSGLCRVAYETAGVVVIEARSGVVAAKLKALAPRLLSAMQQPFPALTGVQVRVSLMQRSMPSKRGLRRIGPTGMKSFTALAGTLPDGPLEAAVRRLIQRQRGSDGQNQALEREERQHDGDHDQSVLEDLPAEANPAPVAGDHVHQHRTADRDQDQEPDDT